jgi:antirestriction protein ArdC
MKQNKYPQNQKSAALQSTAAAELIEGENNFVPAPDEVARRAYFSYVNQGSPQGHEVQHWLAAEQQLLEERKLTRAHGFHNKT